MELLDIQKPNYYNLFEFAKSAMEITGKLFIAIVLTAIAAFTLTGLGIIINELWNR